MKNSIHDIFGQKYQNFLNKTEIFSLSYSEKEKFVPHHISNSLPVTESINITMTRLLLMPK